MRITVIKVAMFEGKGADALKPIFFEIINELLPKEADAIFIDDRKEALPDSIDSDIILLSVDTFSCKRAYMLAKRYKSKDNLIVMGGFHPTVCPKESAEFCDVVICGDAEGTLPEFFADYKSDKVKKLYDKRSTPCDMVRIHTEKETPYKSRYLPLGLVQFSRGCKYDCDFCSVKTMYPGKVFTKPIPDIVEEIKATRENFIFFIDDNILYDEKTATELFTAITPLNKMWACQISIEVAGNDRLLSLMKQSGCICVLIGFESLSRQNLISMGKSANLVVSDYEKAIKNLQRHKLMIYGTFVIGYDDDDENTAGEILKFALKNNLTVANFNPLIPFPGTALYERLKKENRLLYDDRWWLADNYHYGDTAFIPSRMTAESLKNSCRKARYSFYGFKSIIKRFFALHAYIGLKAAWYFLVINIVSGIEIHRKQGALLGGEKEV